MKRVKTETIVSPPPLDIIALILSLSIRYPKDYYRSCLVCKGIKERLYVSPFVWNVLYNEKLNNLGFTRWGSDISYYVVNGYVRVYSHMTFGWTTNIKCMMDNNPPPPLTIYTCRSIAIAYGKALQFYHLFFNKIQRDKKIRPFPFAILKQGKGTLRNELYYALFLADLHYNDNARKSLLFSRDIHHLKSYFIGYSPRISELCTLLIEQYNIQIAISGDKNIIAIYYDNGETLLGLIIYMGLNAHFLFEADE